MSSNLSTATRVALISTSVIAALGLTYAIYFDHRRRHDPVFRKKLLKEQRRVQKSAAAAHDSGRREQQQALAFAFRQIQDEPGPSDVTQREQYFMEQVGFGEQLAARGPAHHVAAAVAFYKALNVYPAPTELITIYQKTQPPQVFDFVMELVAMGIPAAAARAAASQARDPRDSSEEAILTEVEVDIDLAAPPSENGSGTSPSSGSSFVHVDDPSSAASISDLDPPEATL